MHTHHKENLKSAAAAIATTARVVDEDPKTMKVFIQNNETVNVANEYDSKQKTNIF